MYRIGDGFREGYLYTYTTQTKKNSQAVKKGAVLKSLGEKSCEIKGGSQEMAAMMLMLINFLNAQNTTI